MDTYRAPGRIAEGRLQVNQGRLRAALASMRDGNVVLTIERKRAVRSAQANSYYWAVVVKMIAEETGQDTESVHEALKRECNAQHVELVNRASGEMYELWVGKSTAGLNVNDFYEYVERCRAWAGQFLGLAIPDPESDS